MNKRIRTFLVAIVDGKWHTRAPRGIGVTTVRYCIDQGLVRTKRVDRARTQTIDGLLERYQIAFRITAKGKRQVASA